MGTNAPESMFFEFCGVDGIFVEGCPSMPVQMESRAAVCVRTGRLVKIDGLARDLNLFPDSGCHGGSALIPVAMVGKIPDTVTASSEDASCESSRYTLPTPERKGTTSTQQAPCENSH